MRSARAMRRTKCWRFSNREDPSGDGAGWRRGSRGILRRESGWKVGSTRQMGMPENRRARCSYTTPQFRLPATRPIHGINGHRYSHVIDPATGWALEGESSTTVIASESVTADALCTTFSLMSVADGMRSAETLPGVSVLWVRRVGGNWKHYTSRGFPASCGKLQEGGK